MAIKVLKNKQDYEHMDLLNMPESILSSRATKIKAAAAAWVDGEFTLDEILEAIAEKLFTGAETEDFDGRSWVTWDATDYLYSHGWDGIHSHAQQTLGDNDDIETDVVQSEYRLQPSEEVVKTEDLTTETEMETV